MFWRGYIRKPHYGLSWNQYNLACAITNVGVGVSSSLFGRDGTDQSAAACTSLSLHGARRITESNYGMLPRTITESEVGNRGCGGARQRQSMIPNVKIRALKLHYTDCTYFNPSILRVFKVELVLLSGPPQRSYTEGEVGACGDSVNSLFEHAPDQGSHLLTCVIHIFQRVATVMRPYCPDFFEAWEMLEPSRCCHVPFICNED